MLIYLKKILTEKTYKIIKYSRNGSVKKICISDETRAKIPGNFHGKTQYKVRTENFFEFSQSSSLRTIHKRNYYTEKKTRIVS